MLLSKVKTGKVVPGAIGVEGMIMQLTPGLEPITFLLETQRPNTRYTCHLYPDTLEDLAR